MSTVENAGLHAVLRSGPAGTTLAIELVRRVVIGRSADFFGPRVTNSSLGVAVFPGALTGGEVFGFGDLDLLHSYTYIGDVAAGLATLGGRPEGDGRVWHLPTAPARTTRQVHEMIEARVGRPLNVVDVAAPRPVGPFDEAFMKGYAELFYQYLEDQVMDSSALQQAFGVDPTPLDTVRFSGKLHTEGWRTAGATTLDGVPRLW